MAYSADQLPNGLDAKVTPVDADVVPIGDSADSNRARKVTWANVKATLKTYFDGLYPSGSGTSTGSNTGDQTTIVGITGTKAQFDTAVTDGNFLYVGDVTSNATHTGEVTGATALTLDKTAITGRTGVTAVGTDYVLISDTSDTGNLKKALASDLMGAGGAPEGTAVLSTGELGGTKFLREDGDGTCSWQVPAGAGNVSKVGTPVDNQVGVWTGDGTIEGDANLTFDTATDTLTTPNITVGTGIVPDANDGAYLGTSTASFSDLFLASGGVINWANGDVTVTHGTNDLQFAGSSEYGFTGGNLIVYGAGVVGGTFLGTYDTNGSHQLRFASGSDLTANRTLTFTTGDADRTLTVEANSLLNQDLTTDANPQFATIELGHASDTTIARSGAGTVTIEGNQILTVAGGTLTGNITLGENTSIDLDPAGSADGKYSGICITGTAGAALAFGDLVYLATADSRWELTDANAVGTAGTKLIGLCVLAAAGDGSATKILLQGNIRADTAFPALSIGDPAYISETAGDITTTAPTTADAVVRVVGFALTADELYFNPSPSHSTVTG